MTEAVAERPETEEVIEQPVVAEAATDVEITEAVEASEVVVPEHDPETLRQLAHLEQIRAKSRMVCDAEAEWEDANEEAKRLKKDLEREERELRSLIARGPDPQLELPLKVDGEQMSMPSSDYTWRDFAIVGTFSLADRTVKSLEEHHPSITTLGQLSDWQNAKGEFWAKDIKGIGDKARDEIESAWIEFWAKNPHDKDENPAGGWDPALFTELNDRMKELGNDDAGFGEDTELDDEDAWTAGHVAFDNGDHITTCPYPAGTERDEWLRGFGARQLSAAATDCDDDK